jgi:outer membrane lipoprotein-sorting protein
MTSTTRRPLRRRAAWSVPVVTAGLVAAAAVLPGSAFSSAAFGNGHTALQPRTPAELLAAVRTSSVRSVSGTVVETTRLGLPPLPGADRSASLQWQSLVAGSHTARVWADGPGRQRLAMLGQLAESDVVRNGQDLWTYASDTTAVTHAVVPPHASEAMTAPADIRGFTPQAAADKALQAIDPTTAVSVRADAVVAGRTTYTLRLAPRTAGSTIRQVLIAVDGATSVPLRVQVYGAGSSPAFETAFTDISFARPAATVFAFVPPAGASVTTRSLLSRTQAGSSDKAAARLRAAAEPMASMMIGSGWTSIAAFRPGNSPRRDASTATMLDQLSTVQPNGDRLVRTPLVNALLTRDGRAFVGAVTPELLLRAAAGNAG